MNIYDMLPEKIQCDKIASDINFDKCIIDNEHYVKICSWEEYGQRFLLLKLNDNPKYDADTGKII